MTSEYLGQAIALIKARALHRDRVDWPRVEAEAHGMASGAADEAGAYPAIRHALAALGDRHSHLLPPAVAASQRANTRTDDFNLESARLLGLGYLSISGFSGGDPSREAAFTADILARIGVLRAQGVAGWIVDLRENTGGNMWPMLNGLAALLGDGRVGSFEAADHRAPWVIRHRRACVDPTATDPPARAPQPVAVLTGPKTSSSGEAVAVAFRGAPNTRAFGMATSGLSTSNQGFPLSDGALLLLTVSRFADRAGVLYGEALVPDEAVAPPPSGTALPDDPAVQSAAAWLRAATSPPPAPSR